MRNIVSKRSDFFFTTKNRKYAVDFEKLRKFCMRSSGENEAEHEITSTYESDAEGDLQISGKLIREVKTPGNPQNDMILYDVVKLFIIRLLENAEDVKEIDEGNMDFSTSLSLNTLINCGILIEIKD